MVEEEIVDMVQAETTETNNMVQPQSTKRTKTTPKEGAKPTEAIERNYRPPANLTLYQSARNIGQKPVNLMSRIPASGISLANMMDEREPTSYQEALSQSHSEKWKAAMHNEFSSPVTNNT